MARTIEKTVTLYRFEELEGSAKDRARETLQRYATKDGLWHECVIEYAKKCAKLAGFEIDRVMFTGFWSQGDGACFEGAWCADSVDMDTPADALPETYRAAILEARALAGRIPEGGRVWANAKHRGRYYHERSMEVCTEWGWHGPEECEPEEFPFDVEEECDELFSSFASCIYRALEKEYEWRTDDAQLIEDADDNEWKFDEDGSIAQCAPLSSP